MRVKNKVVRLHCLECGHTRAFHMINGSNKSVCQVGALTEDPCLCTVSTFTPTLVWNKRLRRFEVTREDSQAL